MFESDITFAIVFTTMMILLLIFGVVITIFWANRRNIQQEVKMAQLQVSYEQELRRAEHEVQEQVLSNVARDLHDNIGQLLTYMNLQIEQGKIVYPDTAPTLLPVGETLKDTIQQVRMLSRSLNSDFLESGLAHSIQQEIKRLQQFKSITVNWQYDDTEPELSKDQRIMVFRIFQEILNNTLKHSGAKKIDVVLQGAGRFHLHVADNGRGFDLDEKLNTGGSGLKNMNKRAALANLQLNIDTALQKGSRFTLVANS